MCLLNKNISAIKHLFSKNVTELFHISKMANSRFDYVKKFETDDTLLPCCWIVVRIDGKAFHKFSERHKFEKPNDCRALSLMNRAAVSVMQNFTSVVLAYGQSDEYSFVLTKNTSLYNRRSSKISSLINSCFTSSYVFHWPDYFDEKLLYPPCFDSRAILYPNDQTLKDYLSWRQADCHINNLYNTVFWTLVQRGGLSRSQAEQRLRGTLSAEKNEILFSEFQMNYNDEPIMYKKGTVLLRKRINVNSTERRTVIVPLHEDMIDNKKNNFWDRHNEILVAEIPGPYVWLENNELPDLLRVQLEEKYTVEFIETNKKSKK